ncbi:MAG: S41 family peptidase [Anaerolineae bacterium]|nr:S41 family peptidase [Anaerolineae bacterium]
MKLFVKIILTSCVALFIFLTGTGAGYALRDYIVRDQPSDDASEDIGLYWEVWNRVEEQFYGGVPNETNVTYGAIKGSLATLDDPYTLFLEPEPAAQEKASLEGQFGGIGAFVRRDEEGRVILEPMRDQAAEQAGLQTDDVLIGIDDHEIIPDMTTDEIVALIRGEVGTEVILVVEREGEAEPLKLTVTRAIIQTPSVTWRIAEEDPEIGYMQMTGFTERTDSELEQAIDELTEQGAKSFILDLRRNGGGLLDTAIDVASEFLGDGVVVKEDRQNEGPRVYDVRGGGHLLDQPLVVLVDGGTASASEIVAGALQDYERATIIGEKTFGKGSVQLIYELSDKSRLHVTVAKWFTPNDNLIDGVGLLPDIEVLFTEEDHQTGNDPQLDRAITFLQNEEYAENSSE